MFLLMSPQSFFLDCYIFKDTNHRVYINTRHTTGARCETRYAYSIPGFRWGSSCTVFNLLCCVFMEHLWSSQDFGGVQVAQYSVYYVVFYGVPMIIPGFRWGSSCTVFSLLCCVFMEHLWSSQDFGWVQVAQYSVYYVVFYGAPMIILVFRLGSSCTVLSLLCCVLWSTYDHPRISVGFKLQSIQLIMLCFMEHIWSS